MAVFDDREPFRTKGYVGQIMVSIGPDLGCFHSSEKEPIIWPNGQLKVLLMVEGT
jgi:hypothetical protein